ncbi:MAG: hypothetical protein H0Z24_06740 [Thermosipho sp. (in: Bacteria)]|nr:hypothetical protein [Thermosipho sp. (in: thermotogales)]
MPFELPIFRITSDFRGRIYRNNTCIVDTDEERPEITLAGHILPTQFRYEQFEDTSIDARLTVRGYNLELLREDYPDAISLDEVPNLADYADYIEEIVYDFEFYEEQE